MIAEARAQVAQWLSGVGVPVYSYPPPTVAPPAVLIVPASPYFWAETMGDDSSSVMLIVRLMTALGNQKSMDTYIEHVVMALRLAGNPPGPVSAPVAHLEIGTLTTDIDVTLHWKG